MSPERFISRLHILLWVLLLIMHPAAAAAAVSLSFYSKELGTSFPHAFIRLEGSIDSTGEVVEANYGFTATHVTPAVLLGSVEGEVMSVDAGYVGRSDRHFAITLSDAEYGAVLAAVERWRRLPQPSYNLNRRNCVFFVADVAATLGMVAETPRELMKKPRSYLESLGRANRDWLAQRGAMLLREPRQAEASR